VRTEPNFPRNDRDTSALIHSLIVANRMIAIVMLFTGCTLSVAPDGTRHWTIDGDEAARAIIIYTK
jgi:hypothetical protein